MKIIKKLIPLWLMVLILFPSCEKWLDVNPKNQMKEDTQFGTHQGFMDALYGVYQNAAKPVGYGENLTFGFLDVLAQRYENKASELGNTYGYAARYNYTAVQGTIELIFANAYQSAAQCNFILKNIENGVLSGETYNIVKGEALGMRGFLHFDLARLFSDRYTSAGAPASESVPYLTEFTVSPQQRKSLEAVLKLCEEDLKAAEALLAIDADIDQIADNQQSTSADLFSMFRQNRFNYWAVKATLARLYLYKGDKVQALKYAKEVIESGEFAFINPATLIVDPMNVASDLTFTPEHVFSIYVSDLKTIADDRFKNSTLTGEAADYWSTRAKLDALFQPTLVGYGTDIRRNGASKNMWNELTTNIVYSKKYHSDNATNVRQRLVPIIRLPEMYYIAAESAPTIEEGIVYLNEVRTRRLLPPLASNLSEAVFQNEIMLEYAKEFYAEGQLWHYYKRQNTLNITDGLGNPMTPAKYKFPIPLSELEYGLPM